ncbi:WecB/TagA/CpsF family glycosyltransferase [Aequorivita sp. Q41]|uniref:WecB/TagA/CpsF family glycosyltransferase n=1 Tax=Aequorivita sp. Q41 TaxID=3153300 RepID=UPI00324245EC
MESKTIEILGTQIENFSQAEVIRKVEHAIESNTQIHLEGVNAGKLVDMQIDAELKESVLCSNLITADGQSVIWASNFLGTPLKERVAGIDLMIKLVESASKNGYKVFLFGAKEEIVQGVVNKYTQLYGSDVIAGHRNGYFKASDEEKIVQEIVTSGAQMLFVGITSPIKENFLRRHKEQLKHINLIMGVGGSFDVISGKTKRAPLWMQKYGLEWFYRFLQEPRRMWKRYLVGNSRFIYLVLKERFSK